MIRRLLTALGLSRPAVVYDARSGHWRATRSVARPYPCRHHTVVTVVLDVDLAHVPRHPPR